MVVRPNNSDRVHPDNYLTNGDRLVRVLDVSEEWVEVEDAAMSVPIGNDLEYVVEKLPRAKVESEWRKVKPAA